MSFRFIDLYAGIGGFRIPFEEIGGQCVFTSEIDKFARKTYQANFEGEVHGDITPFADDPSKVPPHDLLTAGFPCQSFSRIGIAHRSHRNMPIGLDDPTKGNQFYNICKIIDYHRPKAVLLENVKNMVKVNNGADFQKMLHKLIDELGYTVDYAILNAKYWVPQKRTRVFILATKNDNYGMLDVKLPEPPLPALRSILDSEVDPNYTVPSGTWNCLQRRQGNWKKGEQGFKMGYIIANLDGPAETLTKHYYKDGKQILIEQKNNRPRKLTINECRRLMGFPEMTIPVSRLQAYSQFGNAVVVPVVRDIAKNMKEYLNNS